MAGDYCLLLRASLQQPTPAPHWPTGLALRTFDDHGAKAAHELLRLVSPHDLPDWPAWQAQWQSNAEYDPGLCLLVSDGEGLVGVVHGWTSAYLKDLAVHPRARRLGLGEALLGWMLDAYRQRGEPSMDLRVREDNHPARQLYQKLAMQQVRREPC